MQCKALKSVIKRYFAWIYKSQCRSSSNGIYLCFPLLGLSQCHFTSDVAESTVLNGQGYIKLHILEICTFLLPMLWLWNRFSQPVAVTEKNPKPQALAAFVIEHDWVLKGFTPSEENVLLSEKPASLTQRPRRKVQTRGPFGPTYRTPRGRAPPGSCRLAGTPKHARQRGDTNSDQLGSWWFSCRVPE